MNYRTIEDPDKIADEILGERITQRLSQRSSYEITLECLRKAAELRAATGLDPDGWIDKATEHWTAELTKADEDVTKYRAKLRTPLDDDQVSNILRGMFESSLPNYEHEHASASFTHGLAVDDGDDAAAGAVVLTLLWNEAAVEAIQARLDATPVIPAPVEDTIKPDDLPAG